MAVHVESHLLPFLRGELSAAEASAVRAHLESCSACRAASDDFERIASDLARNAPEPPPIHWGAYRAELREKLERRSSTWRSGWRWATTPLRAALGAGLIAVLVYLGVAGRSGPAPVPGAGASLDEAILTDRLELIARLDLIQRLDLLEDLDVIRRLDRLPPKGDS